jgi:hypothetical protein
MQSREFVVASESSSTQVYKGDKERWCERDNGLIQGKQCELSSSVLIIL